MLQAYLKRIADISCWGRSESTDSGGTGYGAHLMYQSDTILQCSSGLDLPLSVVPIIIRVSQLLAKRPGTKEDSFMTLEEQQSETW